MLPATSGLRDDEAERLDSSEQEVPVSQHVSVAEEGTKRVGWGWVEGLKLQSCPYLSSYTFWQLQMSEETSH